MTTPAAPPSPAASDGMTQEPSMNTPDLAHVPEAAPPTGSRSWTFLTNHGHVLLAVALDPDIRVTEVAHSVGITARHALLILRDLEDAGYVRRERVGRTTHYTVQRNRPFRHPTAAAHQVSELIAIFTDSQETSARGPSTPASPPTLGRSTPTSPLGF